MSNFKNSIAKTYFIFYKKNNTQILVLTLIKADY